MDACSFNHSFRLSPFLINFLGQLNQYFICQICDLVIGFLVLLIRLFDCYRFSEKYAILPLDYFKIGLTCGG